MAVFSQFSLTVSIPFSCLIQVHELNENSYLNELHTVKILFASILASEFSIYVALKFVLILERKHILKFCFHHCVSYIKSFNLKYNSNVWLKLTMQEWGVIGSFQFPMRRMRYFLTRLYPWPTHGMQGFVPHSKNTVWSLQTDTDWLCIHIVLSRTQIESVENITFLLLFFFFSGY